VYFKNFQNWCIENNCSYLPASVAVYLSGFVQQSVSFPVFCAHFYSIKWYHDIKLLPNPCDDKLLQMMTEGAKRILGKPTTQKKPLTVEHLQRIVEKFGVDSSNLYNIRICAMILLGFAGFLRYSEIANLKMS
jgi:hypothetical protein